MPTTQTTTPTIYDLFKDLFQVDDITDEDIKKILESQMGDRIFGQPEQPKTSFPSRKISVMQQTPPSNKQQQNRISKPRPSNQSSDAQFDPIIADSSDNKQGQQRTTRKTPARTISNHPESTTTQSNIVVDMIHTPNEHLQPSRPAQAPRPVNKALQFTYNDREPRPRQNIRPPANRLQPSMPPQSNIKSNNPNQLVRDNSNQLVRDNSNQLIQDNSNRLGRNNTNQLVRENTSQPGRNNPNQLRRINSNQHPQSSGTTQYKKMQSDPKLSYPPTKPASRPGIPPRESKPSHKYF